MTSRVYSTWNPRAIGDGLALDQGNLVVTTIADNLDTSRKVLGTLPKHSALGFFETEFYSLPQVDLGFNVAVGLAQTDSPLNAPPGGDTHSIGYYPATGEILYKSVLVTTVDPIPERTVIGIYMNNIGGHQYMNVIVSGTWVYQVILDDDNFWVPAIMVAGGNATETSAYSNFGQRAFNYPRMIAPPV